MTKGEKNNRIYNSYNAEVAANAIKSVALENISEYYSVANKLKLDVNDPTQKYLLYMQFFPCNCNGDSSCSIKISIFQTALSEYT